MELEPEPAAVGMVDRRMMSGRDRRKVHWLAHPEHPSRRRRKLDGQPKEVNAWAHRHIATQYRRIHRLPSTADCAALQRIFQTQESGDRSRPYSLATSTLESL